MRMYKIITASLLVILTAIELTHDAARAQDYGQGTVALIMMKRGLVWDQWTGRSHGLTAQYAWMDGMFQYPGYDTGIVKANLGGQAVYICGSNWSFGALRLPNLYPGSPLPDQIMEIYIAQEGLITSDDLSDTSSNWIQTVSALRWPNGENYHLRRNALEAEEVVDARSQFNPNYRWDPDTPEVDRRFLPIEVKQAVRLWTGSRQDQMYNLEEFTITNISDAPGFDGYTGDDVTIYDFYATRNYMTQNNYRSWRLTGFGGGQGGSAGASNSIDDYWVWDEDRKMCIVIDGDFLNAVSPNDDAFDFIPGRGPEEQGEWAASGHIGVGIIWTTPDKLGRSPSFHNKWHSYYHQTGMESPYRGADEWSILADGWKTTNALVANDAKYGSNLWDVHITVGPWDISPGESISIVSFQGIGSVDLEIAGNLNRMAPKEEIATGVDSIRLLWDRASLATRMAMENGYATGGAQFKGWNMPDPPACPFDFTITPDWDETGNIISWDDWADDRPDADYAGLDEAVDLASYTVWRSEYLPFMGWNAIAVVPKKAATYYNSSTGKYTYSDRDVKIGFSYYYALSSSDAGHNTWPPRPQALTEYPLVFPGEKVLPQQSNLQASLNMPIDVNRYVPFRTRRAPGKSLSEIKVFPNPFIMRAGFINPTEEDGIHFVNLPADCEIRVYSLRGDLVAKGPGSLQMKQESGSGEAVWSQVTINEQFIESGVYLYVIESKSGPDQGKTHTGKFGIIR